MRGRTLGQSGATNKNGRNSYQTETNARLFHTTTTKSTINPKDTLFAVVELIFTRTIIREKIKILNNKHLHR